MNRPKMAKLVVRNPNFSCGTKSFQGTREKALSLDPEHKPYVRGRRRYPNLPDGRSDTKWIRIKKSWKYRTRKRKQWMPHWMTFREWNWLHDVKDWWWSEEGGKLSNDSMEVPKPVDPWVMSWRIWK